MTVLEAARLGDQIGHTSAWAGLIQGAIAGVLVAAAIVAVVGTGGVAAVFIGAGIAAAGAGGALAGAHIGEAVPSPPKGPVQTGSPDTLAGPERRALVRAGRDMVLCADHGPMLVAQGSTTVYVNGKQLARRSEKTACSAILLDGLGTVRVGGDTATAPGVTIEEEIPPWLRTTLTVIMWGGAILATGGAAAVVGWGAAIGGFVGSLAGGMGLGWVGGKVGRLIGGELGARIGEVIGGLVGGMAGGLVGARAGARIGAPKPAGEPLALTVEEATNLAGAEAGSFAVEVRATPKSRFPGKSARPAKASVAVDRATGKTYRGLSNNGEPRNLSAGQVHESLQSPPLTEHKWAIENCAEWEAVNSALMDGAVRENLVIYTVKVRSLLPELACWNCTTFTLRGTIVATGTQTTPPLPGVP